MYDYELPKELIATSPASPRDAAKLLVYNRTTNEVLFDTFLNLPKYLPKNAVLVFNQTKVIPARFVVTKPTGGKATLFYVGIEKNLMKVMADRKLMPGIKLTLTKNYFFTVEKQEEKFYFLKASFPLINLHSILKKYGLTPLPPYIKNTPLTEAQVREKYQTVFAKTEGSVAAPTASLHFSTRLLQKLKAHKIDTRFVTLHVNLGTFAPVTPENIAAKKLHEEYFEIDPKTLAFLSKAKKEGRPIIAVGTTVVRTLESSADAQGNLKKSSGVTALFIQEGDKFKFIDGMVTNFHVPKSSLLMLVSALIGQEKLLALYKMAIEKKFRFFSFGDGMLLI